MFKILKNNNGFWNFVAPLAASVVGGLISKKTQEDTNAMQAEEAQANRSWEEELSNTAHQREMADLKAAGLNPILTAKYGGSSTPSGSMAQFQNPGHDLAQSTSHGVSSALVAQQNRANIDLTKAQQSKTEAETKYILEGMGNTTKQPWFFKSAKDLYNIVDKKLDELWDRQKGKAAEKYWEQINKKQKRSITVKSW